MEGDKNSVTGIGLCTDEVMISYSATRTGGIMGPTTGADVLGSSGDYSPQGTPNSVGGRAAGPADPTGSYGSSAIGPTTYSPQDSPTSSAGGSGNNNGQLPSFGFTQEQVACVCEVSLFVFIRLIVIN